MPHILVVDDTDIDREVSAKLLREIPDWTVETFVDGASALDRVAQGGVDLIVSDLQMPELDGLGLLGRVRDEHPKIPVIIVTSYGSEEIAVEALRRGAASYVPKRLLRRDLVDTVSSVLAHAESGRCQARLLAGLMQQQATFELPNDSALVPQAVAQVQESLARFGLCEERDRVRIGVALEEALVNAMVHGNLGVGSELRERGDDSFANLCAERRRTAPYCHRKVTLDIRVRADEAVIVIRDEGHGFDVAKLPDPTDPEYIGRCSGRGVLLMRTFLDEVRYNAKGNEVTLVKRRKPAAPQPSNASSVNRTTARGALVGAR